MSLAEAEAGGDGQGARSGGGIVRSLLPQRPRFLRGPRIPDPLRAPAIRTRRLLLRPHRLADADAWYALQSDPRVVEHLAWPLRTRTESFVHLLNRTRHTRLEQLDDFLALAVVLDGRLIGDASLHLRSLERDDRRLDVGWVIGPAWQGQGYAREAGAAMLRLAFERLGAARVDAHMAVGNRASVVVADRLGFTETSVDGDTRVMSLTSEGYARLRDGTGTTEAA